MKKVFILVLIFINIYYICSAQPGERNRAEQIQRGYLTNELKLTPDEAEKFWPVYRSYKEELKKARQEKRDDELAFEETALDIRKKYRPEFKKVLESDQRANRVFIADKHFKEILRRELQNRRRDNPPGKPNNRRI
jgi:pyruvate/2-oxoacid:ferredoxin oxidoreductase beta subunit